MLQGRWVLLTVYGILLATVVSGALKGTRPKFKIATTSTTTTEEPKKENEDSNNENENDEVESTTLSTDVNATTRHTLTGIPQIDYIWDPNLPRELNGYNLSDYPFYVSIPPDINFKCDGLHDGFYASVPHKCQVYHHCLYGTRYDFLCANFTAFDQKTFICHFASEVDCANSKKYWHRNDALYQAATTTTTSTTSTTTQSTTTSQAPVTSSDNLRPHRKRRPFRRRPAYDYYDEEYYDDDYERPRPRGGYDRRDDYEYEDRKYVRRDRERDRERDRDFRDRDRDYRDRDMPRRDPPKDDRESTIMSPRERFPSRNNRREPVVPVKPIEDSRPNRPEDRRYEKGNDYDEDPPTAPSTDSLVKPAAPSASVYARPRKPPQIRRPVPLSEQDRFAYKATSPQPSNDARRRSTEPPPSAPGASALEDDYYEDELEDVRPRRPMMRPRRPFRDRERNFYDQPREMRDRERDRPFRSRYRTDGIDDEDVEVRPRKYQERPRDRLYERGNRDRSLDRNKEQKPERELIQSRTTTTPAPSTLPSSKRPTKDRGNIKEAVRQVEDDVELEDEIELPEEKVPRKSAQYFKQHQNLPETTTSRTTTSTSTSTTTTTTELPEDEKDTQDTHYHEDHTVKNSQSQEPEKPDQGKVLLDEEYTDEYYDEPEYRPSPPPPRTAVRIVKRPFLPSRGGNPSPRGLSPVGVQAIKQNNQESTIINEEKYTEQEQSELSSTSPPLTDDKHLYDAYKVIQTEMPPKRQEFERPMQRRPVEVVRNEATDFNLNSNISFQQSERLEHEEDESERKPAIPWNAEETRDEINLPTGKQRTNIVTPHRLEEIPESEYDVTLNEALTPSFNQESTLPSGFVLPHHRQVNREPVIQPSDNNYKVTRPFNGQHKQIQHQHQYQQQQSQQQKPFFPSPQFLPLTRINSNEERSGSVQYFRTPETVHVAATQFRQPSRGTWREYTGF